MIICTQTAYMTRHFSLEEVLLKLKKAGFDGTDLSQFESFIKSPGFTSENWREEAARLGAFAKENGVPILQSHAFYSFKYNDVSVKGEILPITKKCVEFAGIAGAKRIVVHPIHHFERLFGFSYKGHEEDAYKINMEYYGALAPVAAEYGVQICVENMWTRDPHTRYITHDTCSRAEEFCRWLDTLEERFPGVFTACLDLGHISLVGEEPPAFIRRMGKRIGALHIHDNDYKEDLHLLPGHGKLDLIPAFKALHEVGYAGFITLECNQFLDRQRPALFDAALHYMAETARFYAGIAETGEE